MSEVSDAPSSSAITKPSLPSIPDSPTPSSRVGAYSWYIFWLMCGASFLNNVDRFIFSAVAPAVTTQLHLNDFQYGLISSGFLVVYAIVAFPLGYISERISRKAVVGLGVALWSVATILTGRATGFSSMLIARSAVGVGEGSYYPTGTPWLAAWFPAKSRASVLGWFGAAAFVGAGVGTVFGGFFNFPNQWQNGFYFAGLPGLLVAILCFFARDRKRADDDPTLTDAPQPGFWATIKQCWSIPTFRVVLAQHAMGFFALAVAAADVVLYLADTYGKTTQWGSAALSPSLAPTLGGGLIVVGGIAGGLTGGAWSNRMRRKHIGARVRTGGLGWLWSAPFFALTMGAPYILQLIPQYTALSKDMQVTVGVAVFAVFCLVASFFLNVYNGPTNAALQDVLPPELRAAGSGLELALAHIFGDIYAPALVGLIAVGLNSWLGGENLGLAMLITCPVVLIVAGIVGIWGAKFYRADVEKLGVSAEAMVGV